jgi:alkylation response protein AidB-like acyl-CoA dehydrogenase
VGQRKTLERYLRYLRENAGAESPGHREAIRAEFAERWVEAAVAKQLSYRVATLQARGLVPNYEASISKVFTSELSQRVARTAMKALGPMGMVLAGGRVPFDGHVPGAYMGSVSSTIAGGTSEIQRNIVATRGLGLPRG